MCGAESKFALIVGMKVRPTCTAKDTKRRIIGMSAKKTMNRSVIVNNSTR
jgi:hypothetical protein